MIKLNSKEKKIWFTSDLHFGHKNILKFQPNRNFKTIEEMDEYLINNWNSKVNPDDVVFILGDVSWYSIPKTVEIIQQLNGYKIHIKGNHDKWEIKNYFDQSYEYNWANIDGIPVILFHYPILDWDRRHHGSFHLHGHTHGSLPGEGRRMDVGIDANPNLTLFEWEEIKEKLLAQPYPKSRY